MIAQAILKIKLDAQVSIKGDNIDNCEIIWHDGNPTNITKEQIKIAIQEIANEEANAIAKKESAKAKLAALGLDEEEIKAIIGV